MVYVKMVNEKLRLPGHMINHALYCLCLYFHEYDSLFKVVISITLVMQTLIFNSQMVMNIEAEILIYSYYEMLLAFTNKEDDQTS